MRNKNLLTIFLLVIIGFSVYTFNLNNQLFWDDDEWIKSNIFVHNFSYLKEIFTQNVLAGFGLNSNYYRPLLLLSFAFNYIIHGIAPFGYHLLSNGFHIANGVLIFLLLGKFLNRRTSFLAALLFLIHPVQTEAVTYISGRGDPMSVFFMLTALWSYVKYFEIKRKLFAVSSLLFAIFAVLSRETAILFPLLLMIFYISFLSREKFISALKKSFIVSLPFWMISIVYFILRLTVFNFENTLNFYSQQNAYTENLFFRLYTFGAVLIEYFKIIFYPVGLHMERSLPVATSLFQWPVWFGALIVLGVIFISFLLFRNLKIENSLKIENWNLKIKEPNSDFRIWFFGWAWFFVALGPVSGIIPINAIIYEHWLYLPLIGFATLTGFYLDKILFFLKNNQKLITYYLLLITLIAYFSFFTIQSIKRSILWGRPIEFYEDILKYSPESVRILTNLGNLYSVRGDSVKAAEFYIRAVETPDGKFFAEPYYNLGNIYRDSGQIDKAIEQYQKAIEADPNFPFAYQSLAEVYVNKKQDLISGIEILEKLKAIQPGNPRLYYNLGLLYLATNNFDLAVQNLESGLDFASGRDSEVEAAIKEILSKMRTN